MIVHQPVTPRDVRDLVTTGRCHASERNMQALAMAFALWLMTPEGQLALQAYLWEQLQFQWRQLMTRATETSARASRAAAHREGLPLARGDR